MRHCYRATAASGSEMPSLLSLGPSLNSPNLDLTVKTIAFVGTRLFTFPLVPMRGSRPQERRTMLGELQAVPGVAGAVRSDVAAGVAVCVVSNGSPEAMAERLKLTRLYAWFEGHLFSSAQVARGKPYPDVFLLAAQTMGVPPSECVVIEDSEAGVAAGVAAGMRVFAYDSGNAASVDQVGGVRFHDMDALPALIGL